MLDDLLASEVGTALDDQHTPAFAYMTSSPEQGEMGLSSNSPPANMSHRGSFSGQGQSSHHVGSSGSLPVPGSSLTPGGSLMVPGPATRPGSAMSSHHGSFSGDLSSLTGDGTTKSILRDQLPTLDAQPTISEAPATTIPNISPEEVHQKFMKSLEPQDERLSQGASAASGGGRLEMLLGLFHTFSHVS